MRLAESVTWDTEAARAAEATQSVDRTQVFVDLRRNPRIDTAGVIVRGVHRLARDEEETAGLLELCPERRDLLDCGVTPDELPPSAS